MRPKTDYDSLVRRIGGGMHMRKSHVYVNAVLPTTNFFLILSLYKLSYSFPEYNTIEMIKKLEKAIFSKIK